MTKRSQSIGCSSNWGPKRRRLGARLSTRCRRSVIRRVWPDITTDLLRDEDDEVARSAWRAAAALVPAGHEADLAAILASQFGRGDRDVQLSLSRAFVVLGSAASSVVLSATADRDDGVRAHAMATERLIENPDAGFDASIAEANRIMALLGAPLDPE